MADVLVITMFPVLLALLLMGFPVAFTLAGTALMFSAIGWALGVFPLVFLNFLPDRLYGIMTNDLLIAVPLFIFMGVMLERSRLAEELLETLGALFGPLRGGLAIGVALVGGLLAASTGVVGATVVAMGLLSLPTMLKHGYSPSFACGSICASGTLGQIIPPSIVLILLADQVSSAYRTGQMAKGNMMPDPVSVIDLFAGALIPGFVLVGLYVLYQILYGFLNPRAAPPIRLEAIVGMTARRTLILRVLRSLVPPLLLIIAVLGSILGGIATPTEAASVGAFGAMLLSSVYGRLTFTSVLETMRSTMRLTAMIFTILVGATLFALVFRGMGGDVLVHDFLTNLPGGWVGAMVIVMVAVFVLGFFLDFIEIVFIVVPIVGPPLFTLDVNPVWFSILMAINLQTSFLTPPFGFALFYLQGVAPPGVTMMHIYRGVVPFIAIQLLVIVLVAAFPGLATKLPELLTSSSQFR